MGGEGTEERGGKEGGRGGLEVKSAGSAKCYEKNLRMVLNFTTKERKENI
jgi:hypothetical protein